MEKNDKKITYRTYFIALAMILMLIVIAVKLVTIQIEGDTYRAKVDEKTLREAEITPTQGNLYSDDGSLLATSVTRYDIRWDSKAPSKKLFKENIKPLSDSLSKMFGRSSSYYQNIFTKERANNNRYMLVVSNIGYSEYTRIRKFPMFSKGANSGGFIV